MRSAPAISPEAQALLDQAACGLLRTDGDGLIQAVNMIFCRWTGYERDELQGKRRWQDLLTMGGKIFHQTHWVPLLQMQKSVSEVKFDMRLRDGSTLPIVMNAIRHGDGPSVWDDIAVFVARDRDRYEKELMESGKNLATALTEAQRLEELSKDRALFAEQMVGIVSHDLRNPLSTINMSAGLLNRGQLTPKQHGTVDAIARATQRATRMINDLLDFTQARIGSGLQLRLKPVDFHSLIADCVAELGLAHPSRPLIHLRSGAGACEVDADRLAQLVGNLVANAVTYGDLATPITVSSIVAQSTLSVAVRNRGTPISAELLPVLFQPMTRGQHSGEARSIGLGLFIVSEIAKAHRGTVAVVSNAEATEFTVSMPRV